MRQNEVDIPLSFGKAELIKMLEARLRDAVKHDAEVKRKHQKAEKEFLEKFKKEVREALKWDYGKAKKEHFSIHFDRHDRPSCPAETASSVRRALELIKLSNATKFKLVPGGEYAFIYRVVTDGIEKEKDVC